MLFNFLNRFRKKKIQPEVREDHSEWKKIDRYFKHKNAVVAVEEADTFLYVVLIKVKEHYRNQGIGSLVMRRILWYSKRFKKDIVLEATDIVGSDLERLKLFYRRFGFVEGKLARIPYNHNMYFQAYKEQEVA